MTINVQWNPGPLLAKVKAAQEAALAEAAAYARGRARWHHVAQSVVPTPTGVVATSPDAVRLEKGAREHVEAPKKQQALKFRDGSFVRGPVRHPGFKAEPFLRPTAQAWVKIFVATARRILGG